MAATAAVSQIRVAEKKRPVSVPADSTSEISRKMRLQGSVCLRVLGGSMTPWIRSGDLVFIKRYDFERVSAGDVVLFEREGRFFVHRMMGREQTVRAAQKVVRLITKGDALDGARRPCFSGGIPGTRDTHPSWTPTHRSGIVQPDCSRPYSGALFENEPVLISCASLR